MKVTMKTLLVLWALAMPAISPAISLAQAAAPVNSLEIGESAGATTKNYPVQIGRPFVQGEIAHFPLAILNDVPVATQADVKQRWPDGSVKHAILAFLIPELKSGARIKVTFQDQPYGNNAAIVDQNLMLNARFDFDAVMALTGNSPAGDAMELAASARKMLAGGNFTYWTRGAIATTVILADHSPDRVYDMGFDPNRSFRPIFHATFWPALNKVQVRFIGEIANTEAVQDQRYSLRLQTGLAKPALVYQQAGMTHYAMTRWTRQFWMGGAPPKIAIDPNLAYLEATRLVYNFDLSKHISGNRMAAEYARWLAADRALYGAGSWQKAMASTGGRPDIGPYPAWVVRWLYTGDERMREQAFGNADLAAAWPIHLRESNPAKHLDRAGAVSGVGHILSISERPTFQDSGPGLTYSETRPADRVTPVGAVSKGGWTPDLAHSPDAWSPLYALTGDFWYLEELWFWAGWGAGFANGVAVNQDWGRGPTGAEGGLYEGEIRATAWLLRTRVNTAFVTPDEAPEKAYFTTLIDDALAIEEGARNITGTAYEGNPNWQWGQARRLPFYGQPPLHQWSKGSAAFAQANYGIDPGVTQAAVSSFEQNFVLLALGRARELGYPADRLVGYLAADLIAQLTDPGYNPFLAANGRLPTMRVDGGDFFPDWAAVASGFSDDWQTRNSFPLTDAEHGYDFIALAAASMAANEPSGCAAWLFMQTNALGAMVLDDNPKWAILPRAAADGSACGAAQLAHLKRRPPNPVRPAGDPPGRPARLSQNAFRSH
jgi:hypothetical protein